MLLFEGAWSFYSEHVSFAPVESVADFVAMEIMLLWQQKNNCATRFPTQFIFSNKLCRDNRTWGVLFLSEAYRY